MKTPRDSDSADVGRPPPAHPGTSPFLDPGRDQGVDIDSPEITRRVEAYRDRILLTNAEHGALPFFLASLSFAALFAGFGHKLDLLLWIAAVLFLGGLRLLVVSRRGQGDARDDRRRVHFNVVLLACLGCLYGFTPFWLPANGEVWVFAVFNLWLGGLTVAVFFSQGIFTAAGMAFAVPAVVPLLGLLLFSGDATQILIGFGDVLFFTYLCAAIRRTRATIIEEARFRVRFELLAAQNDEQRQRSDELVEKLTEEIERRKMAEVALREARDAAETMSNRDPLTNLANRREFNGVLAREWLRALRSEEPLSLIICDIDLFGSYNEHYGNRAGDQCLVTIGRLISGLSKRAGDLASRYSGEQFYILLPGTTEKAALDVAESMRQAIHDQTILHPGARIERVVTASFGVATLVPSDSITQRDLIETADHALRRAKRCGGNCVFAIYGDAVRGEK